MKTKITVLCILLLVLFVSALAQQSDPSLLTIDSVFSFGTKSLGPVRWTSDGSGYLALESSSEKAGALDLVRYDVASGTRTIKVSAAKLVPSGATTPLAVEGFDFSADEKKMLIFTDSARVWRSNTRGDYWIVNLANGDLQKLGGATAQPSTLMFAKFSPDGSRVAYVRENNIYVENLDGD